MKHLLFCLTLAGCAAHVAPEPTCHSPGFHLADGEHVRLTFETDATVYVLSGTGEVSAPGRSVDVRVLSSDGELAVVGAHGATPAVEIRSCSGSTSVFPTNIERLPQ